MATGFASTARCWCFWVWPAERCLGYLICPGQRRLARGPAKAWRAYALPPWRPQQALSASGFGRLKSQRPPVPVDFDAANLLPPVVVPAAR
jgi:hypothetical protein